MKKFDVVTVCNALMDLLFEVGEEAITAHQLKKGQMHLVEQGVLEKIVSEYKQNEVAREIGGSALNSIRALALLQKKVAFAGMVADDSFGHSIRERMQQLNITAKLHNSSTEATGTCVVLVTPDKERTMVTYLGASRLYKPEHIPSEEIKNAKIFHFCGYQWDTPTQKEAINRALDVAKANNCMVSFDVADSFCVQSNREEFHRIIRDYADVVFANRDEAQILYGTDPQATAAKIAENNAIAVIKLGAQGAFVQKENQTASIKPVATKVIDTTAAGDMFAGGFLYGLSSNFPLDECGRIAARLASDVISQYGARLSHSVLEQITAGQ